MFDTILFDLDGTLTDSGLGITRAATYALEQMGYQVPPRESLFKFIGPPLLESFQKFCGMDEETATEAVRQFRVYYNRTGVLENEVYPGVVEMLEAMQAAGKRLVLATSKPHETAGRVMAHFGLDGYVPEQVGATDDPSRNTKGKVIGYALREYGIDPARTIMVGDREHDVLGAQENGIPCIGITWGYGDRAELEQAGAAIVLDRPMEVADFVIT